MGLNIFSAWLSLLLTTSTTTVVEAVETTSSSSGSFLRRTQAEERQSGNHIYVAYQSLNDNSSPLEECMGDCDFDSDCQGALRCFLRDAGEAVPGCRGGDAETRGYDFCIAGPTAQPSEAPSDIPSMAPSPFPNIELVTTNKPYPPLSQCQGLCQSEQDCAPGLMCFTRGPGEEVPFCNFDPADGAMKLSADFLNFCTLATPSPTVTPSVAPSVKPTPWTTPKPVTTQLAVLVGNPAPNPLEQCQGDCDGDDDCNGNLICYSRASGEEVPSCYFDSTAVSRQGGLTRNIMSIEETDDLCIDPRALATAGFAVRLRLYWQEDYYWQEDRNEQFWCMSEEGDQLIVEECSSSKRQLFQMLYQPSGQALIQSLALDKCLRGGGVPMFRECDPKDRDQLWVPLNGSWDVPNFEISRIGMEEWCLTQHHHPREGENIAMRDCAKHREYTTSAWGLYW